MAGWRVGFVLGNAEVVQALARLKSYLDYGTFQPIQIAAIVAMNEAPDFPQEVCEVYRSRRDALCDGLERIGWPMRDREGRCSSGRRSPSRYPRARLAEFALKLAARGAGRRQPGHRLRSGRRRPRALRARRERAADRTGGRRPPPGLPGRDETRPVKVVLLPGDGIGPEVTGAGRRDPAGDRARPRAGGARLRRRRDPRDRHAAPGRDARRLHRRRRGAARSRRGPAVRRGRRPAGAGAARPPKSLGVYANLRPAAAGRSTCWSCASSSAASTSAPGASARTARCSTPGVPPDQVARIARRASSSPARGAAGSLRRQGERAGTSRMWRRVVDRGRAPAIRTSSSSISSSTRRPCGS